MSHELHKLAHSLSKSERRQLRMGGTLTDGTEKEYLKLFDVLCALPEFDESTFRQKLGKAYAAQALSMAKAYLLDAITRSGTQHSTARSLEASLRQQLDEIEYLVSKGSDSLALKSLEKGLEIARKVDLPASKAEFLRWKRRLVNKHPSKQQSAQLHAIEQEELQALEQQLHDAKLRALRAQVQRILLTKVYARSEEAQAQLRAYLHAPLLALDGNPLNFHSRQSRWAILAACNRMLGNDPAALAHERAALDDWQGRDLMIAHFPDQYANSLVGFLDQCLAAQDFASFREASLLLAEYKPVSKPRQARAALLSIHLDIRYSLLTGDFIRGINAAFSASKTIQTFAEHIDTGIELAILFNSCSLFFLNGEPNRALKVVNQIRNRPVSDVRQDISDAIRVLEIAIHFELGNFDFLESLQRSMHRLLRLHPRSEDFENLVVNGIKQWSEALPSQRNGLLQSMHDQIQNLEGAANLIGRQEILLWLRSKLERLPVNELIRRDLIR